MFKSRVAGLEKTLGREIITASKDDSVVQKENLIYSSIQNTFIDNFVNSCVVP